VRAHRYHRTRFPVREMLRDYSDEPQPSPQNERQRQVSGSDGEAQYCKTVR